MNSTHITTRYPGSKPFTKEFQNLFYGRSKEVDLLCSIIDTHKITVLCGKSGYGKSSLLNAGLLPRIENKYQVIPIRFFDYNSTQPATEWSLYNIFRKGIEYYVKDEPLFLNELEPASDKISLWQYVKTLQWKMRASSKGILIVMDQFEEFFTYPKGIEVFESQLSEILYNRMPPEFQDKLYKKIEENDYAEKIKEQLRLIEKEPPLKVLIGIRWDKFAHLHKLSKAIPFLTHNQYELLPLTKLQAKEAIEKPAAAEGQFQSCRFSFTAEALTTIMNFLTYNNKKDIEAFQLQIICNYIEEQIVPPNEEKMESQPLFTVTGEMVTPKLLQDVTKKYYRNLIFSKLKNEQGQELSEDRFNEFEKLAIRYFIEQKLINEQSGTRSPVNGNMIGNFGLGKWDQRKDIIEDLISSRLIREEPNPLTGVTYELSHDTLIAPIGEEALNMGSLQEKLTKYYKKALKKAVKKNGNSIHWFENNTIRNYIPRKAVNVLGEITTIPKKDLTGKEIRFLETLHQERILRKIYQKGSNEEYYGYELYEQFKNTVFEEKSNKTKNRIKKLSYVALLIPLLFTLLIWSFVGSYKNVKLSNKLKAVDFINKTIDTFSDKKTALRLLAAIYEKTGDTTTTFTKLCQVFRSAYFQKKNEIFCNKLIDYYSRYYYLINYNEQHSKFIISPDGTMISYKHYLQKNNLSSENHLDTYSDDESVTAYVLTEISNANKSQDTLENATRIYFDNISGVPYYSIYDSYELLDTIKFYLHHRTYQISNYRSKGFIYQIDTNGNVCMSYSNLPVTWYNSKTSKIVRAIEPPYLKQWKRPVLSNSQKRIAFYYKNDIVVVDSTKKLINRWAIPSNYKVSNIQFSKDENKLIATFVPNNLSGHFSLGDDFILTYGNMLKVYKLTDTSPEAESVYSYPDHLILNYKLSNDNRYLYMVTVAGDTSTQEIENSDFIKINISVLDLLKKTQRTAISTHIYREDSSNFQRKWHILEHNNYLIMSFLDNSENNTKATSDSNNKYPTDVYAINLNSSSPSIQHFSVPHILNVLGVSATGNTLVTVSRKGDNNSLDLIDMNGRVVNTLVTSTANAQTIFPQINKEGNILAFEGENNRIIIMDLNTPLVNTNDPRQILSWMEKNNWVAMKKEELKKYVEFASWP